MQGDEGQLLKSGGTLAGGKAGCLADYAGAANGFDTIRLIAASLVIFSHAFPLTGAAEPLESLTTAGVSLGTLAVSAFFLISGFLIPASLDRGSLGRYAVKRARRIMPALVVAVLVCALILGPIMTNLPLSAYFADPLTWRFVGNAAFLPVGYDLPGVFTDHPLRAVNGSLWSLKYEMACYIGVPLLLAITGLRKTAVITAWLASFVIARLLTKDAEGVWYLVYQMAALFRFFGTGMLLYLLADRVPLRSSWAWGAFALTLIALVTPFFEELAATAGAYALVVFAYRCPARFRALTAKGDISYGVYVYAFPIQQLLLPLSLTLGGAAYGWLANSLIALPLAAVAGLVSWLLVERPFLVKRHQKKVSSTISPAAR